MNALVNMAKSLLGSIATGADQLIVPVTGLVKQTVGVVILVGSNVTWSRQFLEHPPGHLLLAFVQRSHPPLQRRGLAAPDGMQLISLGFLARSSSPGRIRIAGVCRH